MFYGEATSIDDVPDLIRSLPIRNISSAYSSFAYFYIPCETSVIRFLKTIGRFSVQEKLVVCVNKSNYYVYTCNLSTHARYVVVGTDAFLEQSVSDFPREYRRTLAFILRYLGHHLGRRHSGLGTANRPGPDRTRFVIPAYTCTKYRRINTN